MEHHQEEEEKKERGGSFKQNIDQHVSSFVSLFELQQ